MKQTVIAFFFGVAFTVTGCFQKSLNPFYTQESLADMEGIVGIWSDEDGYRISLTRKGLGEYEMIAVDPENGSLAKLDVHAFELSDDYYWDFYPDDIEPDIPNQYFAASLLAIHTASKISIVGNSLEILPLNMKWIADQHEKGELSVAANRMSSDEVVLTAPSEALQAFLKKIADSEDAYDVDDPMVWKRVE